MHQDTTWCGGSLVQAILC